MISMEHAVTVKYFGESHILVQQIIFSLSDFTEWLLHWRHGQGGPGGVTQFDNLQGQV